MEKVSLIQNNDKKPKIMKEQNFLDLKKISFALVLCLALLMTTFSVSALTAKIGNARAIVSAEAGDTLQRTIKIINDNDVEVLVELFASGDLAEDIKIIDNNITLLLQEERDVRYEVYVSKEGTTESNINVRFTQVGEKQGVGISSTLIIKAAAGEGFFESIFGGDEEEEEQNLNNPSDESNGESSGIGTGVLLIIILVLVLIALIAIFFYFKKRAQISNSKKGLKIKQKKNVRKS